MHVHVAMYFLAGQQLTFKGTSYANNTLLFITDLGDVDNNNVLCMTDLAGCCTGPGRGHWIYPDGFLNADGNSLVRNNPSGDDFFRTRGVMMVVRLERRNNAIGPTGQYCCQVPTMATPDTDIDSTMCVILSEFQCRHCFMSDQKMEMSGQQRSKKRKKVAKWESNRFTDH